MENTINRNYPLLGGTGESQIDDDLAAIRQAFVAVDADVHAQQQAIAALSAGGGGGGYGSPVFEFTGPQVNAVSIPMSPGIYEIVGLAKHTYFPEGSAINYLTASIDNGATYNCYGNSDYWGLMRYGVGYGGGPNQDRLQLSDLWSAGSSTMFSIKAVISAGNSWFEARYGYFGSTGPYWSSMHSTWKLVNQVVNRVRIHSEFWEGSFIKAWKVA